VQNLTFGPPGAGPICGSLPVITQTLPSLVHSLTFGPPGLGPICGSLPVITQTLRGWGAQFGLRPSGPGSDLRFMPVITQTLRGWGAQFDLRPSGPGSDLRFIAGSHTDSAGLGCTVWPSALRAWVRFAVHAGYHIDPAELGAQFDLRPSGPESDLRFMLVIT
jgi:hypothetical protein